MAPVNDNVINAIELVDHIEVTNIPASDWTLETSWPLSFPRTVSLDATSTFGYVTYFSGSWRYAKVNLPDGSIVTEVAGQSGEAYSVVSADNTYVFFSEETFLGGGGNGKITKRLTTDLSVVATCSSTELTAGGGGTWSNPEGIATDGTYVWVVDGGHDRIVTLLYSDLSFVSASGVTGVGIQDFNGPVGLATNGTFLWVADTQNDRIKKIQISTMLTTTVQGTTGTGIDQYKFPIGVAYGLIDGLPTLLVSDFSNNRISVRNATDLTYYNQFGVGANTSQPRGVAFDSQRGYVADTGHLLFRVWDAGHNPHSVTTTTPAGVVVGNDTAATTEDANEVAWWGMAGVPSVWYYRTNDGSSPVPFKWWGIQGSGFDPSGPMIAAWSYPGVATSFTDLSTTGTFLDYLTVNDSSPWPAKVINPGDSVYLGVVPAALDTAHFGPFSFFWADQIDPVHSDIRTMRSLPPKARAGSYRMQEATFGSQLHTPRVRRYAGSNPRAGRIRRIPWLQSVRLPVPKVVRVQSVRRGKTFTPQGQNSQPWTNGNPAYIDRIETVFARTEYLSRGIRTSVDSKGYREGVPVPIIPIAVYFVKNDFQARSAIRITRETLRISLDPMVEKTINFAASPVQSRITTSRRETTPTPLFPLAIVAVVRHLGKGFMQG